MIAMTVFGVLEGAASQGRTADLGRRIGAAHAAGGRLIQLAIGLEAPDNFRVLLFLAERLGVKLLERVSAGVLGTGLEPAAVDLVPNLPEGNALVALQAMLGGLEAKLLPHGIILWRAVPIIVGDGIQHLGHVGDGDNWLGAYLAHEIHALVKVRPVVNQVGPLPFLQDAGEYVVHPEPFEAALLELPRRSVFVVGHATALAQTDYAIGDFAPGILWIDGKHQRLFGAFGVNDHHACLVELVPALHVRIDLDGNARLGAGCSLFAQNHQRGMVVVVASLKDVVDIDFAAIATVELQADDLAGGGFVADGGGNLQLAHQPAELLVVGTRVAELDGRAF